MNCPFPGMDPYIERPELWPDFHDTLVTFIKANLQPALQPRYAAITQDRLYVMESERPIRPDVSIVKSAPTVKEKSGTVAILEPDSPMVFELWREEIREPVIQIIEPAAGNRVVTAIEVLSPANKTPGAGRKAYIQKRDEIWDGGTSLVELDLLREGEPTIRLSADRLASLHEWRYLVAVTRRWPSRQEVYAIPLTQRLPRVSIPLAYDDKDVTLDLQAAFTKCWEASAYPALLHYQEPPLGKLSDEELAWCDSQLKTAGLRNA